MNLRIERREGAVVFTPVGRLDVGTATAFLNALERELNSGRDREIRVDVGLIEYIDSAGAAVLLEGYRRTHEGGASFLLTNVSEDVRQIFALTEGRAVLERAQLTAPAGPQLIEWLGEIAVGAWKGAGEFLNLAFQATSEIASAPFSRRSRIRWDLTFLYMSRSGWDAVPIVFTISILMGIVLALQAAIQLERYGALIFVADLVAVSLTRELGPLMTAIIVAGRSGSAFAAEIGTMKVNEEVDALKAMGLSPINFLVIPKFLALTVMTPCLAILANTAGILGGLLIAAASLNIVPNVYMAQTLDALQLRDIVVGLLKSVVFAGLIAATGCFRGFEVEGDADSVGRKTTSAVVTSVFLVIIADALFTSFFYLIR